MLRYRSVMHVVQLVGAVLDGGGDINAGNHNKETPLYFAKPELARKFGLKDANIFYGTFDSLRTSGGESVQPKSSRGSHQYYNKVLLRVRCVEI